MHFSAFSPLCFLILWNIAPIALEHTDMLQSTKHECDGSVWTSWMLQSAEPDHVFKFIFSFKFCLGIVIVPNASDHGGHQPLQLLCPLLACLENFLMVGFLLAVIVHHSLIGDQRQSKDAHSTVTRHDYFMNRAHSWEGRQFRYSRGSPVI